MVSVKRSRFRFLAAAVVLLRSASPQALAQAPDAGGDATTHYQNGVRLYYQEGNVHDALVEFQRSYELSRNWQILFALGQASYEVRDHAAALQWFQKYLLDGGAAVPSERRKVVETDIEELKRRVGRVTVESNVAGAQVSIDDRSIGVTPLANHVVNVGEHRVTVSLPGWQAATKNVLVAMRDSVNVSMTLDRLASDVPFAPTPATETRDSVRPIAWPYFVVAAAGAGMGAVFGVLALGRRSDLDSLCDARLCPESAHGTWDSMHRYAVASTVGFATSIVSGAVGTYFSLRGRRQLAVGAGTGSWQLALTGSF